MKAYQIHFIRCGLTEGNLKGQYIGSTDLPLCEKGKLDLRRLDYANVYPGAAALISSPLRRCRETAEILYPALKPIIIHELRECDFGEIEGLTAEELKDVKDFGEWIAADKDFSPFGGESGEHFSQRVCGAFEQIVYGLMKTGTTQTVIVTHGGIISMLLSRYGLPEAGPTEWHCDAGCGFSVRVHPQLWMTGHVFEVYGRIPAPREEEDRADDDGSAD